MALVAFLLIFVANYAENDIVMTTILPLLVFVVVAFILLVAAKSIPYKTLYHFASIVIVLLSINSFFTGEVAFWSVLGIGIFHAIMWSNIFTLSIDGLGRYTDQHFSLPVMMIPGGAVIPSVQGLVVDGFGVRVSFIVPVFGYLYLVYFGLAGRKMEKVTV